MVRCALVFTLPLLWALSASAEDTLVLVGRVTKVTDGDTIKVQLDSGLVTVRFDAIDAPERNQAWGVEASAALSRRLENREVELEVSAQDRYDRLVATVYLAGGSVNEWMVKQGHAWAYRQYTKNDDYCSWEGHARTAERGLWRNRETPQAPWDHRALKRRRIAGAADYSNETVENCIAALGRPPLTRALTVPTRGESAWDDCEIKGNDSGIYHLPGSASYNRTKIDELKGERWFCTEEEAKAAGWRPRK